MIRFTDDDAQMLAHTAWTMRDQIVGDDDYTDGDRKTVDKLSKLAQAGPTVALGLDDFGTDPRVLFQRIVMAEVDAWVPGASLRLIHRAARTLGETAPDPSRAEADCGPDLASHATVVDWQSGLYLRRCVHCLHLFRV